MQISHCDVFVMAVGKFTAVIRNLADRNDSIATHGRRRCRFHKTHAKGDRLGRPRRPGLAPPCTDLGSAVGASLFSPDWPARSQHRDRWRATAPNWMLVRVGVAASAPRCVSSATVHDAGCDPRPACTLRRRQLATQPHLAPRRVPKWRSGRSGNTRTCDTPVASVRQYPLPTLRTARS